MLEQDRADVADDVEDVALLILELGVGHGVMDRVVQRRQLEARDLEQIAQAERRAGLEHVAVLVQAELDRQHAAMHRVDALADLEPDDRRELAIAQLGLDQRHQIVGVLLLALGVGVAGHPEELAGIDRHAREQTVEAVRHDLLQAHEAGAGADPQIARHALAERHLDPGEHLLRIVLVMERDQKVEREVRDEGERVRRVHRERRHQREDVVEVVGLRRRALLLRQLRPEGEHDALLAQALAQLAKGVAQLRRQLLDHRDALGDLLLRGAPVHGQVVQAGADLLLEPADPLHEELVEVRVRDRQELDALEQRRARITRLVQDPAIEGEPGQLAVQIEPGRAQVDRRRHPVGQERFQAIGRAVRSRRDGFAMGNFSCVFGVLQAGGPRPRARAGRRHGHAGGSRHRLRGRVRLFDHGAPPRLGAGRTSISPRRSVANLVLPVGVTITFADPYDNHMLAPDGP